MFNGVVSDEIVSHTEIEYHVQDLSVLVQGGWFFLTVQVQQNSLDGSWDNGISGEIKKRLEVAIKFPVYLVRPG